jgi:SAM-dependent methyltransferase
VAWLHDLRKGLSEIARVLKPGGYFVLSMDNPNRWWVDPPLLLKGMLKNMLKRGGLRNSSIVTCPHYYSFKELYQNLSEVDLILMKNTNIGFGPFTLFDRSIFSDRVGVKIHQRLQQIADSGQLILRMCGSQYVILAVKRSYENNSLVWLTGRENKNEN